MKISSSNNLLCKKIRHVFGGISPLGSLSAIGQLFSFCNSAQTSFPESLIEVHSPEEEVVIALGSNVGNRIENFNRALQMMKKAGIKVKAHAQLYETAPAYVTDQPFFLNSAVRAITKLGPHALLSALKEIEKDLGRTKGIRYGPRPIDLDILFYGRIKVASDTLIIPHKNIWERPFVLAPLVDLIGLKAKDDTVACWHSLTGKAGSIFGAWEKLGGEHLIGTEGMKRVFPIGNSLLDWSKRIHVMGVLNLTPDSFSDGGQYISVDDAVAQVRLMISEGADMIDIGAQSTRPGAKRVSSEEELSRILPVLEAVRHIPEAQDKILSVDTFDAKVAYEAVKNGVDVVNDVSGGRLDSNMFSTVADLEVPYILMHMRGNPSTMQNDENTTYGDVCKEVADELCLQIKNAESYGIPAWRIITDPGLGFSKTLDQNMELLGGLPAVRQGLAATCVAASHGPILIGPSRKSFLGKICGRVKANERDPATIAAVTAGVLGGANIVRVHNVKDNLDAVKICNALSKKTAKLK
ncbi:hypothetical protein SUGI_0090900 [Cryptomeria japonica]|uniref:folate synthesis bifunctional protein, mitochondrial n=1 Tax=Cryptomeria japonica TaxID=3369 RepID=UPI002408BE56|nr:folate synthesis bifunctional protein, mitochondrial [Cryptomeria japonica]GLJ08536.1 hypothetical protein SUGI_0090900 [Cryptomeria japonica]